MILDLAKIKRFANHPAMTRPAGRLQRMHDACPTHAAMTKMQHAMNPSDATLAAVMESLAGEVIFQAALSVSKGGLPEGIPSEDLPEDFVSEHLDFMLSRLDDVQEMSLAVSAFLERCELLAPVDNDWARSRIMSLDETELERGNVQEHGKAIYAFLRGKAGNEPDDQTRNDAGVAALTVCSRRCSGWKPAMAEARKLLDADIAAAPKE